jgi:hypothetical protein
MEYWKIVEGFKSRYGKPYFVSSLGRFKNGYGRILCFHPHKKGYLMVSIPKDGKEKRWQAHRLVAKAFIPNPDKLPQVNHLDGDKKNNQVSNLQWCTNLENMRHSWVTGLRIQGTFAGEKSATSHLTNEQAKQIRDAPLRKGPYANLTRKSLAEMYNVTEHVIKDVRAGKSYRI